MDSLKLSNVKINWKEPFKIHKKKETQSVVPTPQNLPILPSSFSENQIEILEKLKKKQLKKVVCLVGAGISVGAGIPDFRTPKQGLFAKFADYNVPYPEALFEKEYFIEDPLPIYKLIREILQLNPVPTPCHHFLKLLEDKKILHYVFTQNIDGLERKAGLRENKFIEAHGTLDYVSCLKCKKTARTANIKETILQGTIPYCQCGGLFRPKVLFYEEKMPVKFTNNTNKIAEADLVIILGTSLKVAPFDGLLKLIDKNTPVILINKEKVELKQKDNVTFFIGDAQEIIQKITNFLQW